MNSLKYLPENRLHPSFKYTVLGGLFLLTALTFWLAGNGQLAQLDEELMGDLFRENNVFLEDASRRAQSMTLMLAELHAGLMVLQSSQFGISFFIDANIQLGNIISQLTDMVAYGRNFALFNLVALHIIETLLALIQWITPWLVVMAEVGLMAIITAETWLPTRNRWHMSFIRFGEGVIIMVSLMVVIFPLSVNMVNQTSKAVTNTLFHSSYQAVSETRQHILRNNDATSIKNEASDALDQYKNIKVKLSDKTSYLATHLTQYVAITLLEVFILPLLFSIFMLWFFHSLLRRHRHWNM